MKYMMMIFIFASLYANDGFAQYYSYNCKSMTTDAPKMEMKFNTFDLESPGDKLKLYVPIKGDKNNKKFEYTFRFSSRGLLKDATSQNPKDFGWFTLFNMVYNSNEIFSNRMYITFSNDKSLAKGFYEHPEYAKPIEFNCSSVVYKENKN